MMYDPTCKGCVAGTQDHHTCQGAIMPWPQPLIGHPDPKPVPAPVDPNIHCRWHAAWKETCVWCHAVAKDSREKA